MVLVIWGSFKGKLLSKPLEPRGLKGSFKGKYWAIDVYVYIYIYVYGGCQNHGLLLGPLNTRCRVILGTMILTTTHIGIR